MKFVNKETGVVLEPKSQFVEDQLKKDPRYKVATGKQAAGSGGGDGKKEKPVEQMNKAELMDLAAQKGVEVNEGMTNKELAEAILAVDAE